MLPRPFLERMERLLADEYPAFLASYDEPRTQGLRANTLKVSGDELQRRLGEPRAAAAAETAPEPGETTGRASHLGRPGEVGRPHATRELPLKARFADGFQLASEDDEFDLRFHVLNQTDFKLFTPNDRTFGKSGLYVPGCGSTSKAA